MWCWEFTFKNNDRWAIAINSDDTLEQKVAVTPYTDYVVILPLTTWGGSGWPTNIVYFYIDDIESHRIFSNRGHGCEGYINASGDENNENTNSENTQKGVTLEEIEEVLQGKELPIYGGNDNRENKEDNQ